jgi:hypothetical protein
MRKFIVCQIHDPTSGLLSAVSRHETPGGAAMMTFRKRPWTRSAVVTIRYGDWPFWSAELFGALIVACLLMTGLTHYPLNS